MNPSPSVAEGSAPEDDQSLPELFREAMEEAEKLESSSEPTVSSEFQEALARALELFERFGPSVKANLRVREMCGTGATR